MKNDNVSTLLDLIRTTCYEYRSTPFKLSSGKFSNHYFDCRNLLSSPNGFNLVGKVMAEILITKILNGKTYPDNLDNYFPRCELTPYETCYRVVNVQAIGGMAVGSISVSNAIMANLLYKHNIDINTFYVRKISKDHGKAEKVVGIIERNSKVVVIDDVLTSGQSIRDTIEAVQEERQAVVVAVLVVIDREEGGSDFIKNKFNIPVISVFTKTDILGVKDKY